MNTPASDKFAHHSWYCPAIGAYQKGQEDLPEHYASLNRFPWVALYAFPDNVAPPEWVLRSYFSETDGAYFASHRTIPEKTASNGQVVMLYAAPGAPGNDNAGHVPPKKVSAVAAKK